MFNKSSMWPFLTWQTSTLQMLKAREILRLTEDWSSGLCRVFFCFLYPTCLTTLFHHWSIPFPSTFSLGAYLATRTCRAADILHMWSDRGTRLILLVCSQTQLAVHCGQQETWPGLAGARLGGKLTLGGKRLEAAAQVSLHMLAVSGQAQLPDPL